MSPDPVLRAELDRLTAELEATGPVIAAASRLATTYATGANKRELEAMPPDPFAVATLIHALANQYGPCHTCPVMVAPATPPRPPLERITQPSLLDHDELDDAWHQEPR